MSGLMDGIKKPVNGKKADVHKLPQFTIVTSIAFPVFVLSYAADSYFVMGIYSIIAMIYFSKISVNHGNKFRVVHLMTKRRVPLWIIMAILSQALFSSANKETENYLNEIASIKGKCKIELVSSDKFKIANMFFRTLALGVTLTEAGIAEMLRMSSESLGITIDTESLYGRILINMGAEIAAKHRDDVFDITEKSHNLINAKCENIGFVQYGLKRIFYGIFDIFYYAFHNPFLFIIFPLLSIFLAYRVVKVRRKEAEE